MEGAHRTWELLVWRSYTHEREARGSGCKPIIRFVPLECTMNIMLRNNQRKVT